MSELLAEMARQLRCASIELGGWSEREDVPGDVAREMMARWEGIRDVLKKLDIKRGAK